MPVKSVIINLLKKTAAGFAVFGCTGGLSYVLLQMPSVLEGPGAAGLAALLLESALLVYTGVHIALSVFRPRPESEAQLPDLLREIGEQFRLLAPPHPMIAAGNIIAQRRKAGQGACPPGMDEEGLRELSERLPVILDGNLTTEIEYDRLVSRLCDAYFSSLCTENEVLRVLAGDMIAAVALAHEGRFGHGMVSYRELLSDVGLCEIAHGSDRNGALLLYLYPSRGIPDVLAGRLLALLMNPPEYDADVPPDEAETLLLPAFGQCAAAALRQPGRTQINRMCLAFIKHLEKLETERTRLRDEYRSLLQRDTRMGDSAGLTAADKARLLRIAGILPDLEEALYNTVFAAAAQNPYTAGLVPLLAARSDDRFPPWLSLSALLGLRPFAMREFEFAADYEAMTNRLLSHNFGYVFAQPGSGGLAEYAGTLRRMLRICAPMHRFDRLFGTLKRAEVIMPDLLRFLRDHPLRVMSESLLGERRGEGFKPITALFTESFDSTGQQPVRRVYYIDRTRVNGLGVDAMNFDDPPALIGSLCHEYSHYKNGPCEGEAWLYSYLTEKKLREEYGGSRRLTETERAVDRILSAGPEDSAVVEFNTLMVQRYGAKMPHFEAGSRIDLEIVALNREIRQQNNSLEDYADIRYPEIEYESETYKRLFATLLSFYTAEHMASPYRVRLLYEQLMQ